MEPMMLQVFAVLSFFASSVSEGASFAIMVRTKPAMPRGMQQAIKLMIAQMSIGIFKTPEAFAGAGVSIVDSTGVGISVTGASSARVSADVSVFVPQAGQNFAFSSS